MSSLLNCYRNVSLLEQHSIRTISRTIDVSWHRCCCYPKQTQFTAILGTRSNHSLCPIIHSTKQFNLLQRAFGLSRWNPKFPKNDPWWRIVCVTVAATIGVAMTDHEDCYCHDRKKEMNFDNLAYNIAQTVSITSGPSRTMLEESLLCTDVENEQLPTTRNTTTDDANLNHKDAQTDDDHVVVWNWSGTHSVSVPNERYWEPTSIAEVESIVRHCYDNNIHIRPVGSALSPNGISFNDDGMINLSNLDEIIAVDVENRTITVQAGARVSQVIEALRPYQLTLPNLASIAEQQMGGFVQVGAHGTGMAISPIDQYVTSLKLVTPTSSPHNSNTITLSSEKDGDLFHLAKVGLGSLGIVVELTMECIPAHHLIEHTYVLSRAEAVAQLTTLLRQHKHIRYMWIPYTDAVVVVTNDPLPEASTATSTTISNIQHITMSAKLSEAEKLKPFTDLLTELQQNALSTHPEKNFDKDVTDNTTNNHNNNNNSTMQNPIGFGELRDAVLSFDPLNPDHVRRCNEAEAQFWKNNSGYQIKPSDQLLQFDCGGQQWVWEVCFPTGTQVTNNGNDMKFMEELLHGIEHGNMKTLIAAHAPIEQRWSASSSSLMSPAYYDGTTNGLYCWVGIINYLPSLDATTTTTELTTTTMEEFMKQQRSNITKMFQGPYCNLLHSISKKYNGTSHWAKIELPKSVWEILDLRLELLKHYPIEQFNQARTVLDPKNLLANNLINTLFGKPKSSPEP